MTDSPPVLYESHENGVATITLNRPRKSNAQNRAMVDLLDATLSTALDDDDVRVIVLQAAGPNFSGGHDLSEDLGFETLADIFEDGQRRLIEYGLRWRDAPKPTIAAVHGACMGAGLCLVWACDLVVAADDAYFADPVVQMGTGGQSYHAHTWELGHRRAKEILFLGKRFGAEEAREAGMVNRVVPRADLHTSAMDLAAEIATQDPFALRMAKRSVNQTQDIQGFKLALDAIFNLHEVAHGHLLSKVGRPYLADLGELRAKNRPG